MRVPIGVRPLVVVVLAAGLLVAGCESDETEEDDPEVVEQTDEADDPADEGEEAEETDDAEAKEDDESAEASESGDEEDREEDEEEDQEEDGESAEADENGDETAAIEPQLVDSFDELPIYATGPVAVVDGEEISADEFNAVAEQQLAAVPDEMIAGQGAQIRQMLIEGAVVAFLLERELEQRDIEVDDAEIDEALEEFDQLMEMQAGDQLGEMQALMEQQGIDDAVLREQAEHQLALEKLIAENADLSVSEQEIQQFYDRNAAHLQQQEPQVRARHILLNVDDDNEDERRQKIENLLRQIENGEAELAELAAEHSDCPTASEGGDLGYFTRDQLMPEFTDVAFELDSGELSDPVRSDLGWHVIYKEDHRESGGVELDEVRDQIEMQLEAQRFQQAAGELAEELRDAAELELQEDNVVVDG